jgi:chaperonin cofactor prefoldin
VEGYNTVAYKPTTEILEEKIETLKSRIDQLESTMNKKENKLRSTLKTLTYVREI